MPSSIRRIDVAGRDVTEYMQLLFRKSGYVFQTSAEKEVVRAIKEKTGYVALDPKKEDKEWQSYHGKFESKAIEYALPDGQKIKVSGIAQQAVEHPYSLNYRWGLNDIELPRYYSIPKSLASNIQAFIKLWSTQSTVRTWIFGNPYSATLYFREVQR